MLIRRPTPHAPRPTLPKGRGNTPPGINTVGSALVSGFTRSAQGGVLLDRRPGVEVRWHHAIRLQQLHGFHRVVRSHRKAIADRQHRHVETGGADQFHVVEQPGVAGEVDLAVGEREQEPTGIAAAGAIGQHRAVMRDRHLHAAKRQIDSRRRCSSAAVFHALLAEPFADFKIRHDRRAGAVGDGGRVGHVVEVAVRHEHEIGFDLRPPSPARWASRSGTGRAESSCRRLPSTNSRAPASVSVVMPSQSLAEMAFICPE